MTNVVQRSFAGGEIAPELYARTDQVKYATGLRTLRNMLVQRHGGAANRAGTDYLAEVKTSSAGPLSLRKFVFNDDQTYVLEFGDRYLRVYRAGGQVVVSGVAAWVTTTAYTVGDLVAVAGVNYYCTVAHTSGATTQPGVGADWRSDWYALAGTIYEIPTPYAIADVRSLQTVQSGDVVTIVHPSYPPRELQRTAHTRWTLPLATFAPAIGGVLNLATSGGAAGTARWWAVTAIDEATGEEGLPTLITAANRIPSVGTPTTLTWDPLGGALSYGVYRSDDGVTYGLLSTAGGTLLGRTDSSWTTTTASASTAAQASWTASAAQARNACVATVGEKAYDGKYTITGRITLQSSNVSDDSVISGRIRAYYSRNGETRVDAGIIGNDATLLGGGISTTGWAGTLDVPDNGYATLTIDLVPEVYGTASTAPTFTATVDVTTAPDNVISWNGNGSSFVDTGLTPDYLQAPPTKKALFVTPGGYPSAATYYQQRRLYASTTAEPERVWASRSGVFSSFTISSPLQDDDMVSFSLASREVNAIRHMLDVGRLLLFTAAGEWVVGESEGDVLTPSSINARQRLYYGASTLPPIVIGNTVLFVQSEGSIVRDLMTDVVAGYRSNELTLFAAHLTEGYTITDWDFAKTPHSIAWAVRSDGTLLGLTYLREHEVWGWHRHDTDGVVENVCVVKEGAEHRVYLVVARSIAGVTRRFVERMAVRTITAATDLRELSFVDCALGYDGRNVGATTFTLSGGVTWGNGETVTCTASSATFVAGDVGNAVVFYDAEGEELVRGAIEGYTSPTVVTVRPSADVPVELRAMPSAAWGRAVDTLTGLAHLEGKAVSVYADGIVAASPNNPAYPITTVAGGQITLATPAVVVRVGLPYTSDLETLDIDTPQGPSMKTTRMLVNRVKCLIKASRGGFAGTLPTVAQALTDTMDELKYRDASDGYGPIALRTQDIDADVPAAWNGTGRLALRQVDPLPLTVLAVIPQGVLPQVG